MADDCELNDNSRNWSEKHKSDVDVFNKILHENKFTLSEGLGFYFGKRYDTEKIDIGDSRERLSSESLPNPEVDLIKKKYGIILKLEPFNLPKINRFCTIQSAYDVEYKKHYLGVKLYHQLTNTLTKFESGSKNK